LLVAVDHLSIPDLELGQRDGFHLIEIDHAFPLAFDLLYATPQAVELEGQ